MISTKGVDPDGIHYVQFIDRVLDVVNDVYNHPNKTHTTTTSDTSQQPKFKKGELQCTIIVLAYLMNHSPHYLAPSYNQENKASVLVELNGMSGYYATNNWLNTCVDRFLPGEIKPMWAYNYGSYTKSTVSGLYPKYNNFLAQYKKHNPRGYFSNTFTKKFFDDNIPTSSNTSN